MVVQVRICMFPLSFSPTLYRASSHLRIPGTSTRKLPKPALLKLIQSRFVHDDLTVK